MWSCSMRRRSQAIGHDHTITRPDDRIEHHSNLSAIIGSGCAARRAGKYVAISVTAIRRHGELSSSQEQPIELLTHSIVDQSLGTPLTVLEAVSEERDSMAVIEAVHRVFTLGADPS
jgi:Glutamyl-tRNAGlu reductase, dimerisation domain